MSVKEAGAKAKVQSRLLDKTSDLLEAAEYALDKLSEVTSIAAQKAEGEEQARYFHEEVMPAMDALRMPVDQLEMIVNKELWPMPSYGDLIFEV